MFTTLTDELLDLTSSEKGYTRAKYALELDISSCSCCQCLFLCFNF